MTAPDKDGRDAATLYREARDLAAEGFGRTVNVRRGLQAKGMDYDAKVMNAYEFLWLLTFDLTCLLTDMVQAKRPFESKLYGRLLILTLHASLLEMRSLFARELRGRVVEVTEDLGAESRLKALHSQIQNLFEVVNSEYGQLRNELVAHWTRDPSVRDQLLERVDVDRIARLSGETVSIIIQCRSELDRYGKKLAAKLRAR
jgi:hypothetical protein